jgi:peptidoglycan/xylan/chitin deacetylase (PgdA/CDA1 family)
MRAPYNGVTLAALLCAVLVLTGCAAGSPSVVAPVAPDTSEVLIAEAPEAAPQVAAAQEATIPDEAPAAAVMQEPAATAPDVPDPAGAEAEPATAAETAAFAREAPAVTAPLTAPAPAAAQPANEVAAAPAAQTPANRPPPPPDPGTGMSTIVEGGSNGRLEVALTFDAGADTGYGAAILDLLGAEGIPATFGMTGLWAQANPNLVQRMAAEGHQLINHTWDHASLTGANTGMPPQTPEQVAQQLADTEAVVREATGGYEMRPYFRPPYGDYDATSLGYLSNNGYYLSIWWTCDSHGWAGWGAQEIVDYCTTNIVEDEILLLHVGNAAVGDFEALPGLIQFFRDNGYEFVTIEQMLQP